MDAEDPLYILYTSGSTGKPKGILHTTGGYLTGVAATTKDIFDIKDDDVYWCTADVGWVTGHSYVVYGPLANGATVFMYEGAPDWPAARPLLGLDREVRRHDPLHGPDSDPRLHEVGDGVARKARHGSVCASSAPSASRSTRRRGSGTTSTSAGAAAPLWIPGGRPRPARS